MLSQSEKNEIIVKGIRTLADEIEHIRKNNQESKHFAEMLYARIDTLYKAASQNVEWFEILSQH